MGTWHVEKWIRLIAGSLLLVATILAKVLNPEWVWVAAFVGFMFFQSTLTGFCPMEMVLKALGVPEKKSKTEHEEDALTQRAAGF